MITTGINMNKCPNCKSHFNPVFMVHDDLWELSKLTGYACILCFERAIGRRIEIQDLKPRPLCNHNLPVSWFLGSRPYGEQDKLEYYE